MRILDPPPLEKYSFKETFNDYVNKILPLLDHHLPLQGPPLLVHIVIEYSLMQIYSTSAFIYLVQKFTLVE